MVEAGKMAAGGYLYGPSRADSQCHASYPAGGTARTARIAQGSHNLAENTNEQISLTQAGESGNNAACGCSLPLVYGVKGLRSSGAA